LAADSVTVSEIQARRTHTHTRANTQGCTHTNTHRHTDTHACTHAHTHTPSDTGAKKRSGSGTCWRWTIQPQERGREGHANARTHTGNGRYSSVTRQRWGHAQTYSDAHICTQTHIQIRKPPRQQHGVSLVPARRENGNDGYIHRHRLSNAQRRCLHKG
jgi:hypothetical protein